jgi:hypothetical protein
MAKKNRISMVQGEGITITKDDYISLTDMLKAKDGDFFISDRLRNRNTVEYPGIWERIHNPDFNCGEFAIIKGQAGLSRFALTPKQWVEKSQQVVDQISSRALVQSKKPIAQQAVSQFETKIRQQAVAQLTQIPWGQNITKNLPDEFRLSLPSIEEIEAELSGAEESQ